MWWRDMVLGAALASSVPAQAAASCDDSAAVWATSEKEGVSHRLYRPSDVYFIEEWRNGKRAWRTLAAWMTCSNGVSTCWADFQTEKGDTLSILESIDDDDDGLSEWMVIGSLWQDLRNGGGAKVEWDEGFASEAGERLLPKSNAYKFFGCPTEAIALDKSTPFVARDFYAAYVDKAGNGSTAVDGVFPDNPGTIWWMTGARIEAADFRCSVKSFNKDRTVSATCTGKGDGAIRDRTFSFEDSGTYVELEGQPLRMVTDRSW